MSLRVLVVDDEQPILDELVYLLERDERVGEVHAAVSGAEALRMLDSEQIDAVFLDIAMPALSGLDVARVLAQFRRPPQVVFVTAHDDHAVDAFDLNAVDYVLKPVREDRLRESVRRILGGDAGAQADETIAIELGGVTRFVSRSQVSYVEAQGDYARLHTTTGESHLLRSPLTKLEHDWAAAGFLRIHRSLLLSTGHVEEVRVAAGRCSVLVDAGGSGPTELQVARRHTRELREVLRRRTGVSDGEGDG